MQYIKNLFLSIKEIIIIMFIQYALIINCIIVFGIDKSIVIGTIFISIFELFYIFINIKRINITFKYNYISYILLGVSISIIYNMVIFNLGIKFDATGIPLALELISSGIIAPIFEELLFRYNLINKLFKYNNKNMCIFLSSFIFAIFHTGIVTIIYAFIIGLFNSYLYIKKKDILVPIMIHISANVISCFLFDYNIYILILGIILFGIVSIKK